MRTDRGWATGFTTAVVAAVVFAGCGLRARPATIPAPVRVSEQTSSVVLRGQPLALHLSAPVAAARANALVVYGSGDGGWFGSAVDMFHHIGRAGYYAVGFSSRALLKLDARKRSPVNVEELAGEYMAIVAKARADLKLAPETPVVLTGWSRGASLAVLAATRWHASPPVEGLVAIGLGDGEDFEINGADDETDDGEPPEARGPSAFAPYVQLSNLASMPRAVIQSTGDQYLRAPQARMLFGDDARSKRLYAITAKNHRFSGGEDSFHRALLDALDWITGAHD